MRIAGHCHRHQELSAKKLVLWEPTHGHRSRGHSTPTFVDVLKKCWNKSTNELARCMANQDDWRRQWKACLRTTQYYIGKNLHNYSNCVAQTEEKTNQLKKNKEIKKSSTLTGVPRMMTLHLVWRPAMRKHWS